MSFASTAREGGFSQLVEIGGSKLALLNSVGGSLCGVFSTAPYIDPPFTIASDTREKACMEASSAKNASTIAGISLNDQAQDEGGNVWKVIMREDNPADFTIKFWFVKVITGTDI